MCCLLCLFVKCFVVFVCLGAVCVFCFSVILVRLVCFCHWNFVSCFFFLCLFVCFVFFVLFLFVCWLAVVCLFHFLFLFVRFVVGVVVHCFQTGIHT